MQITVTPDASESRRSRVAAAKLLLTRSHANAIVIGAYVACAVIAYVLAPGTWPVTSSLAIFGIAGTVWALQLESRRRSRRAFASDPHALEEYHLAVDASGVRTWCAHVDARYTWDGFTQVRETTEFYFFLRPLGAVAIPKRALDAEADAELREWIRTRSPDRGEGLAREAVAGS